MAITRLWQATAELADWNLEWTSRRANAATDPTPHTGTRSFRMGGQDGLIYSLPASASQWRMGFYCRHPSALATGDYAYFARFDHPPGFSGLRYHGTNGLEFYAGSTLVATLAVATMPADTWQHVGIDINRAASGWAYLWIDGAPQVTYTGNLSANGTAMDEVLIGSNNNFQQWATYYYADDLFLDDTSGESGPAQPPDLRFELRSPTAAGSASDWTGSDGNSVDNHLLVDETPPDDDTTYVEANAADLDDYYDVAAVALPAGYKINAVISLAVARKTNAGVASQVQLQAQNGASVARSAAQDLATTYGLEWHRFTTDPAGAEWTEAAADATEYGVRSAGSF